HAAAAISGAVLPPQAGLVAALIALAVITVLGNLLAGLSRGLNTWVILGVPYVGLPAIALAVLRSDPGFGMQAIFWLLAVVWATDSAAYFTGRLIGGPKLAPAISPKKTWAGAIG